MTVVGLRQAIPEPFKRLVTTGTKASNVLMLLNCSVGRSASPSTSVAAEFVAGFRPTKHVWHSRAGACNGARQRLRSLHGHPCCWRKRSSHALLRCSPDSHDSASISRSLDSLDSLLGEDTPSILSYTNSPHNSSEPGTPGTLDKDIISWPWLQTAGLYENTPNVRVEQPQVRPILSFILYYWQLCIYSASFLLDVFQGPGAGSDLIDDLVNDHITVLQGQDVFRLLSFPLVHVEPWSLFITLLALGTIGAELEGLIGYSAFAAMYLGTAVWSGLADAYIDQVPVTRGTLPFIAAIVGGLLVTYSKNALFAESLEAAQQGKPIPQIPDPQQSPSTTGLNGNKAKSGQTAAEVEFAEGLLKVEVPATPMLRAAAAIATGAVAALEALYDLQQDDGTSCGLPGVAVGFATGALLAWGMAPQFMLRQTNLGSAISTLSAGLPAWLPLGQPQMRAKTSIHDAKLACSQQPFLDSLPVLLITDKVPTSQKAAVTLLVLVSTAVAAYGCATGVFKGIAIISTL